MLRRVTMALALLSGAVVAQAAPAAASAASLELAGLVSAATAHHPSILAARNLVAAAAAGVTGARQQYLPTPAVQWQQQDDDASSAVVSLTQPVWAGGRIDAGLAAAQARQEAASFAVAEAAQDVALRVAAAWGSWQQSRGRIEALDAGVELLGLYAASVDRRIAGGAAGQVDRDLVTARLAQTEGERLAARAAERAARARLSQLVGRSLRAEDLVYRNLLPAAGAAAPQPLPSLPRLTELALAHAPQLQRLQADLETAVAETDQQRAAQWPTLALRAQHQRDDNPAFGRPRTDNRVMFVLDYAPGAGLSAASQADAAAARAAARRDELAAARSELLETLAGDYEDALAGADRLVRLQQTQASTEAVLASYDRLFIAGKRSWLDVLNAAREVIQARTALADTAAQLATARARLAIRSGQLAAENAAENPHPVPHPVRPLSGASA